MLANDDGEPIDARVRRRLRELRTEQGLTLQHVSDLTHIDVSMLSRLESGKRRISLDHVPLLASALGVSADDLLGGAPPVDPRVRHRPATFDDLTVWPLTNRGRPGGFNPVRVQISATRCTPPATLRVHDGHDWMYVVAGRLRLVLGDQDLVVEPGEAVEFSTLTPHWFGAVDGVVEVIAVFGPHGERSHLHE
jgi:transcriptional regulator with XRE-family HTH domain